MQEIQKLLSEITILDRSYFQLFLFVAILGVFWLLTLVYVLINRPKKTRMSRYPFLPRIKFWAIVMFAAAIAIVAMSRPLSKEGKTVLRAGNVDVISVIDKSISMKAKDIEPSRLELVKQSNIVLAQEVLRPGDRASVFTFGTDSFRKLYLSGDTNRFVREIARIRFPSRLGGDETIWNTDISLALEHVCQSLDIQDLADTRTGGLRSKNKDRKRMIFIFTDGDDGDTDFKRLQDIAGEFRRRNIKIFAVGVGTKRGYPLLSLLDGYKKDEDYDSSLENEWKGMTTRLETKALEYISRATGGLFFAAESKNENPETFIRNAVESQRDFSVTKESQAEEYTEFWQYVVCAALFFVALAIILY